MDIAILFILIGMTLILTYSIAQVADLRREVSDLHTLYGEEIEDISSDAMETSSQEDTMYEEFLAERNTQFEERITRIKDELGKENTPQKPATTADILHPHVENLPHDSVPDYDTRLLSVEYSE